ncbi:hypothetical protein [Bradyrhizobium lupini]|uniref:hypothetical protein n=1 Tax=Rhizobium lupini TaxID=136996 RepID=UPI000FFC6DE7
MITANLIKKQQGHYFVLTLLRCWCFLMTYTVHSELATEEHIEMTHAARRAEPARSNAREQLPRALVGRRRPTFLEHDIAAAPQAAHYYRPSQGQNRCAMEIDGERVLVDVSTFTIHDERAVVLRHDGSIGIEFVSTEESYPQHNGRRTAWALPKEP